MALDFKPEYGKSMRARAALPRTHRPRPQWRLHSVDGATRAGGSRSQQRFLRALEQLPAAIQGPVLRPGRVVAVRPTPVRRARPRPLLTRLLAGELQLRSVLLLSATLLVVVIITAFGSDFL